MKPKEIHSYPVVQKYQRYQRYRVAYQVLIGTYIYTQEGEKKKIKIKKMA